MVGRGDPDRDIQWIDLTGAHLFEAQLARGAGLGLPTAYELSHRYIGLPLSQALVRSGIYELARRRPYAARQPSRSVNLGRAK